MVSCQVSEKLSTGPVNAQTTITRAAPTKTSADPAQIDILPAIIRNLLRILTSFYTKKVDMF